MIQNSEDFIFYSEFKYPPVNNKGERVVASGDYDPKVLASGFTMDQDWSVYEKTEEFGVTRITKNVNAYISPSGILMATPNSAPCTLIWRQYGY